MGNVAAGSQHLGFIVQVWPLMVCSAVSDADFQQRDSESQQDVKGVEGSCEGRLEMALQVLTNEVALDDGPCYTKNIIISTKLNTKSLIISTLFNTNRL